MPYYHVVFTLPAPVAAIAFGNKAVIYDLLFRTAADALRPLVDCEHSGVRFAASCESWDCSEALASHYGRRGSVGRDSKQEMVAATLEERQ